MRIPPIPPIRRAIFSPIPTQRRQDMKFNNVKVTEIDKSQPPEDEITEPDITADSVDDIERRANDMFVVLVAVLVVVMTFMAYLFY